MKTEIVKYVAGLLPSAAGKSSITDTTQNIERLLSAYRKQIINEFCEKHDLCEICITGGYECNSDHK